MRATNCGERLDPGLWEPTHNPWVVLQTVARDRLERALADPAFRKNVDAVLRGKREAAARVVSAEAFTSTVDLCCVFQHGIHVERSAAHLLRRAWKCGRRSAQSRQRPGRAGGRSGTALPARLFSPGDRQGRSPAGPFPYNDPGQLPITPLRQANGEWLRLEIALPGYSVWLRAWQVQVGQSEALSAGQQRRGELSCASSDHQPALWRRAGVASPARTTAGIGGWRLLRALGIQPEVCHLNEGHAAFAVLERARSFMQETAQPFEVALAVTRAGNFHHPHGSGRRF